MAFAIARAASTVLLFVAVNQLRGVKLIAGPPFRLWRDALIRWDATYYESIARVGYPDRIPVDAAGAVMPNTWAFLPAFPLTARVLAMITTMPFEIVAAVWNLAAGAAAAVLLARLVRTFSNDDAAFRAALFWMCLPTAFLLHVPYSEPTFMLFAMAALVAMAERRTAIAVAAIAGAGLSRGFVLPLSAAAIAHLVISIWTRGRSDVPSRTGQTRRIDLDGWRDGWLLLAAAMAAPFLWPAVAAFVSGRIDAFVASQGAWGVSPALGDFVAAWRAGLDHDGIGLFWTFPSLTLAATVGGAVALLLSRAPGALKMYGLAAAGLIVLLAQPGAVAFGSVPRFAFTALAAPIALALIPQRGWMTAGIVAALTWLQYLWILNIWSGKIGVAP